ncbi:asparaginase [Salinadaptatus halalkaliphilus]|uniref:Asparaginase n=1 Tax=Salinadaptatus halalkaliphilus TaxID=2419781 RepID=A0A4S3TIZ3_9EURY|nr:asparaginase [Salinadaptatus halalkaliphilus]THE63183.1 asparaginase [Salinadaptatus halalkaliphilus]
MPSVHAIATGGTIAGTSSEDGTVPTESVQELARDYPDVFDRVDVELDQLMQTPSSELALEDLEALAGRIRAVADDVDGVVVFHGTDTIEETAYFLDLVLEGDVPVVLTGAQRAHDQIGPDGPANVCGAFDAASHEYVRDGVYVFFNERLHAARPVTKHHSSNPDAYDSGNYGPVAERTPDGFWFYRRPESLSRTVSVRELTATVTVVPTSTDTDGDLIRDTVDRGVDGIVVDGLGLGNVPENVAAAVADAIEAGVTVVVTTRCRNGVVAGVYGSGGGGRTLEEAGTVFASNLSAHKARLKLLVALSARDHGDDVRGLFDPERYDGHGYVRTE